MVQIVQGKAVEERILSTSDAGWNNTPNLNEQFKLTLAHHSSFSGFSQPKISKIPGCWVWRAYTKTKSEFATPRGDEMIHLISLEKLALKTGHEDGMGSKFPLRSIKRPHDRSVFARPFAFLCCCFFGSNHSNQSPITVYSTITWILLVLMSKITQSN